MIRQHRKNKTRKTRLEEQNQKEMNELGELKVYKKGTYMKRQDINRTHKNKEITM